MTDHLTHDLTRREVGPDDQAAVMALVAASGEAVLGYPDVVEEEIAADLTRKGMEHRGWYADDGTLVGYGWVRQVEDSETVEVDVYVHPEHDERLGDVIVGWAADRARELAGGAGHTHALLDGNAYRQDDRTRAWFERAGFEVATTFTRMRIDLHGPVEVATHDGVTVRVAANTEEDRRLAYTIREEAFTEHYGFVATPYESFVSRLDEGGEGWTSMLLAELDGEPVGVLVASRQFEPDQDAGYVRTLAVLPAGRGRGVAKALLGTYFDQCQRAGRAAVLLHVDVANVTGALRLYESVGMRTVLEIDAWANRVVVDSDAPA
jgi:ribosomal protein S18 acetylase RimI-like enzyme